MATILVIDNTPLTVLTSCHYLEKQGHTVKIASSTRLGLMLAKQLKPDVILLDMLMPDVDAQQVLRELNEGYNPSHPSAPIIVISNSDKPEDLAQCLDLGAADYLSKPVDMTVLAAKVRAALKTKYSLDILARTNQHLSLLASIDPLTQMYNRRRLFELSVRELAKAQRFGRSLSVIMLDMDHFKEFNDTYGHATGDEVLQLMAQVLLRCTRATDIAGRLGGEEFAICCPETTLTGGVRLAERIREQLHSECLLIKGIKTPVTASIGVASLTDIDKTFDGILNRADTMMYQAKQSGRNQVLSA